MKGLADFARESTKAEETRLKQEEVKLKREMLKKGLGIEDSTNGPGRSLGARLAPCRCAPSTGYGLAGFRRGT